MPIAESTKVDRPIWFLAKVVMIYIMVLLDMGLNSSINSDDWSKIAKDRFWPVLFIILQTSIQVFIFLTLFLMMCGTYLMRIGLPGVVLSDFKYLAIIQGVYLLLTMVMGVLRLAAWGSSDNLDPRILFDYNGFGFVFTLHGLAAAVYYFQVIYSSFKLSEEKYYQKSYLGDLSLYRSQS